MTDLSEGVIRKAAESLLPFNDDGYSKITMGRARRMACAVLAAIEDDVDAMTAGADSWRCECGDLNRARESDCYRLMTDAAPVEVTTRYATTVPTLTDAWAFVMRRLDSVGPNPAIEIQPRWTVREPSPADDFERMFEVVVEGMVPEAHPYTANADDGKAPS